MLPIFGSIRKLNSSQLADFCCKRRPQDYERISAIGLDDLDVCPLLNAAAIDAYPSADALLRNPTTGMVDSCARAASGHADAPPISAMKCRRLTAYSSGRGPHPYLYHIE